MKIPNKIKILGHDTTIKLINQEDFSNSDQFGDFHEKYHQIRISREISTGRQIETLIHEVVEYINAALELELKHNQVQALSATLYQVISDNTE